MYCLIGVVSSPYRYSTNASLSGSRIQGWLMFQALIGILRTTCISSTKIAHFVFQALIGILRTRGISCRNVRRMGVQFQALIGILRTTTNFYSREATSKFQALIGILRTLPPIPRLRHNPQFQALIGILRTPTPGKITKYLLWVSSPYRYSTNAFVGSA